MPSKGKKPRQNLHYCITATKVGFLWLAWQLGHCFPSQHRNVGIKVPVITITVIVKSLVPSFCSIYLGPRRASDLSCFLRYEWIHVIRNILLEQPWKIRGASKVFGGWTTYKRPFESLAFFILRFDVIANWFREQCCQFEIHCYH